jgi:hypothetical protein
VTRSSSAIINRVRIPRFTLAALLALTLLGGCGGSSDKTTSVPGGADSADVRVIDGWVTALAKGDVKGAASYFAVPSVAQNGTPPLHLNTRGEVIAFNASLPCGARLVRAERAGRLVAATFRLTDRPGGACGPGAGGTARTAFLIRDGKIVQWRRLPDRARAAPTGPVV